MTPQMRTALVRGQVALGVPRPEAEDFARFVAETLHVAQSVRLNEKATVPAVASSVLSQHVIDYADLSTKELRMQVFCLTNPQNSHFLTPQISHSPENPNPAP